MAKTTTLRKRFAKYPVLARAAAGILPALWEMGEVVAKTERGALGETALHWAMQDGRADWAVAWARAGGAVLPDAKGASALHWMASAVSGAAMRAMWSHPGFAAAYAPHVEKIDAMGRDVAGLCCLALSRGSLEALAEHAPEALSRGVRIGLGSALGLADAMLAMRPSSIMSARQASQTGSRPASSVRKASLGRKTSSSKHEP